MTDAQLAALTSQVRHYVKHYDDKAGRNNPEDPRYKWDDEWACAYFAGASATCAMILGWLESGLYESMVNLDTDKAAADWLTDGTHG